jgi:hypothetical protein
MTRIVALAGVVALALGGIGLIAREQRRPIDLEASDCSSISHRFGDDRIAQATEHTTIPVGAGPLDVRPDGNGGLRIERGADGVYGITACIGAGAATLAEAQAAADSIHLDIHDGQVRVRGGAAARSWSVEIIVTAPDGASITAETANGPISLADVHGNIHARAANGPISVSGSGGDYDLQTSNGPLSVNLDGRIWAGHLAARATNGPLALTVAPDYESGVEVSSTVHTPWNCRAAACRASSGRDWNDRTRRLRVGTGPVVVQLSTVNGPVSVSDR